MVALKFMRSHEQFLCELRSRSCLAIQKDHVVGISKHYGKGEAGTHEVRWRCLWPSHVVSIKFDCTLSLLLTATYPCMPILLTPLHLHPLPFPGVLQEEAAFRLDAIAKGFQAYPYCLVMEAGDDTLKRIIGDQHIAGNEEVSLWTRVSRAVCNLLRS